MDLNIQQIVHQQKTDKFLIILPAEHLKFYFLNSS